jgi:hypothetical protein
MAIKSDTFVSLPSIYWQFKETSGKGPCSSEKKLSPKQHSVFFSDQKKTFFFKHFVFVFVPGNRKSIFRCSSLLSLHRVHYPISSQKKRGKLLSCCNAQSKLLFLSLFVCVCVCVGVCARVCSSWRVHVLRLAWKKIIVRKRRKDIDMDDPVKRGPTL